MPSGLRLELRDFLYRHFESSTSLEALLYFARSGQILTVEVVSDVLAVTPDAAMDIIVTLYWQGFLARHDDRSWRYAPRDQRLGAWVTELLGLPISRIVAEIESYAAPRRFADAFRLRKAPKPGGGDDG